MSTLDEFGLTEEQVLIRRNVAELLARVLPPEEIRRLDEESAFPHAAFDALAEELKAFVKDRLAPFKYPRLIEFVAELPKTATGKIQRFKLREREQAGR